MLSAEGFLCFIEKAGARCAGLLAEVQPAIRDCVSRRKKSLFRNMDSDEKIQ